MDGVTTTVSAKEMPERFRGPREAGRALVGVVRGWLVFLQIAAPWVLALAAWRALWEISSSGSGARVLFAITAVLSAPTMAVAWHRWIIQGRRPRLGLAFTGPTALGYAMRLWGVLALGCLASLEFGMVAGGYMQRAGPLFAFVAGVVAAVAVAAVFAMAMSRPALRLPALAVGDAGFPPETPGGDHGLNRERALGLARGIPSGVALSFIPLAIAGAAVLTLVPTRPGVFDPVDFGGLVAGLLLIAAAMAAAAGCLSNAYLLAKTVMVTPASYHQDDDDDEEGDEDD